MNEEILAILEKLIKSYTSAQSSSVSYETAQMLLEAIHYCMAEYYREKAEMSDTQGTEAVMAREEIAPTQLYKEGYEAVLRKVYKVKEIYERLILDFDDYGCTHYRDTILKGMPAFFLRYDPKFCPQDHILTLDYPVSESLEGLLGVDRIYRYLQCVELEKEKLSNLPREVVIASLQEACPEYKELFFDNIWQNVCQYCAREEMEV